MMDMIKKLKKYSWVIDIIKSVDKEDRSNVIEGYKNRKAYYTSPLEGFEADLKEMVQCANCPNMCRFDCPALQVSKIETYAPANKARIGYLMGMGRIPLEDPTAINTMYACMTCDACREWCPMDISTGDLLVQMRVELEKRNLLPEKIKELKDNVDKSGSVFEESPFKKYANDPEINVNDPNPEILFYIGCMDLQHRLSGVKATIALLKYLKIPFCTKLEDRECCGGPVYKAGIKSSAVRLPEHNKALIEGSKVKKIIANCPGCLSTLKNTYNEVFGIPFKKIQIQHTIDFIKEMMDKGKIKPTEAINTVITYHDPCILARSSSNVNNTEKVRAIFSELPGVQLKEAYLSKNQTQCCGMGGAYHVSNPEYSEMEAERRFLQLNETNPDYIVSGCPTCEYGIELGMKRASQEGKKEGVDNTDNVKIIDIVELVAQSLGLKY